MKLRWLIKTYPKPTKEECEALLETDGSICTIVQAYSKLKKSPQTILQIHIPNPEERPWGSSEWVDIPVVVEEQK